MTINTSYDSKYGTGDRREFINVINYEGVDDATNAFDGNVDSFVGAKNGFNTMVLEFNLEDTILLDEVEIVKSSRQMLVDMKLYVNNQLITELSEGKNSFLPQKVRKGEIIKVTGYNYFTPGGTFILGFGEINLKSRVIEYSTLIKKDNQYGYYTDSFQSLGTSYPTKEQFEKYGMSNLSMLEADDVPVEYEMELVSETEEEKCFSYSFDLNGQHKNLKSIDAISFE